MAFLNTNIILGLLIALALFYYLTEGYGPGAAAGAGAEGLVEGFDDNYALANCSCPFQCSDVCPQQGVKGRNPCARAVAVRSCLRSDRCPRAKTGVDRAAWTDRDCLPDTETLEVKTPCGPVATFNAHESPLEHAWIRDENRFRSQPDVINNIKDNATPAHMVGQVVLRRGPSEASAPLPENAVVKESPCNFVSEKTNLESFFRRNTNLFFRDQQQFPIHQLAWDDKADCWNNIMYSTDLSPKEHYIVNKI